MEFEMINGVLVPKTVLTPIYVFIDETDLLGQTGSLQSGISVPQDIYTELLVPHCQELLQQLGKDVKEFKGKNIKKGNKDVYQEFVQSFVNVAVPMAKQASIYSIVAVDATDVYSGEDCDWILKEVLGALAHMGIHDERDLATEFSGQILWLHKHYKKITAEKFANDLILCFDNKHQYAKRMQALRAFASNKLPGAAFWQLEKAMTSCANTLLQDMEPKIPIARIERFYLEHSSAEFGLQAADLFCHLVYSGIKHELGIVEHNTTPKLQILREFVPGFALHAELRGALAVCKGGVRCVDPSLCSSFQFRPV